MRDRSQSGKQYVLFVGGGTTFAAPISQVLRIARREPMTRVPRAPAFLEGVMNDHSQVVPVVDLRKRMDLPTDADPEREKVLILALDDQVLGLLVDDVVDIVRIGVADIHPPPAMVAQVNGVYLTGVTRLDERVVLLLDLDRILSLGEVDAVRRWGERA